MREQDDLATQETIAVETTNLPGAGSLIGAEINGRYHIIKRLGSGGMGDVFLAQDKNVMNRERVVKLLKSEALGNREIVRKFRQETEALARLNDPGIVMILDSGTYGKQPFLVLEYVPGEDLSLIISPVLFSVRDFPAPQKLAERLSGQKDPLAEYVWSKFSPTGRGKLNAEENDREKAKVLRDELTALLADAGLYRPDLFSIDERLVPQRDGDFWENGDAGSRFNRELLENAFAGEIVRGKNKILSAEETALIFRQLGTALAHGHEKGIIHRDLKPANIMVSQTERGETQIKLIDFGVAKVQESLIAPPTEQGLSFGTRKYMSPEQVSGRELTKACDVYALGLIAFEVLTGQHIFRTESFLEQCRMQENEEFSEITVLRPNLPPQVKDVICRAVSFKPENRQSTADEFGRELADALLLPVPAGTEASIPNLSEAAKTEPFVTLPPKPPVSVVKKPIAAETEALDNRDSFKIENLKIETGKTGRGKALSIGLGVLVLIALLGTAGWFIRRNAVKSPEAAGTDANSAPAPVAVRRELNYKLIVQKYQLGKPFQAPFDATGDEIFGDDWRFKVSLSSPQSGNLYLLSENPNSQKLTMLFPHPNQNDGSSAVAADAQIQTGEMAFDKNQGTENFWIVWAEKPLDELEAVKSYVNPQDLGAIKDAGKEKAVRDLLDKTAAAEKLTEKTGANKQSKILQTTDDILVKMAEFRHN